MRTYSLQRLRCLRILLRVCSEQEDREIVRRRGEGAEQERQRLQQPSGGSDRVYTRYVHTVSARTSFEGSSPCTKSMLGAIVLFNESGNEGGPVRHVASAPAVIAHVQGPAGSIWRSLFFSTIMSTDPRPGYDTVWPADSVEFCPGENSSNVFVCGTYNLEKQTEEETALKKPQVRRGKCLLFEVGSADASQLYVPPYSSSFSV